MWVFLFIYLMKLFIFSNSTIMKASIVDIYEVVEKLVSITLLALLV